LNALDKSKQVNLVLPEGYYLDNFLLLIGYLEDHYPDILSDAESQFIHEFKLLNPDPQRLFVRLISRKGPYFIKERLRYPEISHIDEAIRDLEERGWLKVNTPVDLGLLLPVFSKSDLHEIMTECSPETQGISALKKDHLMDMIMQLDTSVVISFIYNKWTILLVERQETIGIFLLLFFGNNRQNLSDFILEDIGVLRYEPYDISDTDRLFDDRQVLLDLHYLNHIREHMWLAIRDRDTHVIKHLHAQIERTLFHNALRDKLDRTYEEIGRFYERMGWWDDALNCYRQSQSNNSRERQIRILEKKGHLKDAYVAIEEWFRGPDDQDGFPGTLRARLARKLGMQVPKRNKEDHPSQELVLSKDNKITIEYNVLNHFLNKGWNGFYAENYFWRGLFGLAFWDIIFSAQPRVFFNPYQRGPADLFQPAFRQQREQLIAERLIELSDLQKREELILARLEEKRDTANYLVSWKHMHKQDIQAALNVIHPDHLVSIFDCMAEDLSIYASGFPDLVLLDQAGKEYILTEVKGPGDQIRLNQKRWFRCFKDQGIPYQLVHVKWTD